MAVEKEKKEKRKKLIILGQPEADIEVPVVGPEPVTESRTHELRYAGPGPATQDAVGAIISTAALAF